MLYEGDSEIQSAKDIDFDQEWLSDRIRDLPRAGQVVGFRLVELLEAAVDVRDEDEFRLYKEFEPQKIQQALNHVSWGEPLPNANHRTGIAMLQFCIESVEPNFEMPRTHVDDDTWREWVNPYIVDSKRLITAAGITSVSSNSKSWTSTSSNGKTGFKSD